MLFIKSKIKVFLLVLFLLVIKEVHSKRGRGRNRSKNKIQIGLPITGKYRDPESDQYYNHNDVIIFIVKFKIYHDYIYIFLIFNRELKLSWHHILTMNMYLDIK